MECVKSYDFKKEYFKMDEEAATQYSKEILGFFDEDSELECKEIGDGNLNYVFRIVDEKNNKSVIIKQAGPVARISDEFVLSTDRNRIESEILMLQKELAPGLVPDVYKYDSIMNCCCMEDLSDHEILRSALLKHKSFPLFADHISTFMVNTLLLTSDVVKCHKEKKDLLKSFINPELCEISEDLVYTEPFYDCSRNEVFELTKPFAKELMWDDKEFLLETAKLKFEFMTHGQSLLHGDLHSGSIFIKEDSTKVIDPEFAFYGPAGYDIGNVLAHTIFAYVNAKNTMTDYKEKEDYIAWVKKTLVDVVDMFVEKFNACYDENVSEYVAKYDGFREVYLNAILSDTAGICGLELARRILGLAKVKDITTIEDDNTRFEAEKYCLRVAKELIMDRDNILTGKKYLEIVEKY